MTIIPAQYRLAAKIAAGAILAAATIGSVLWYGSSRYEAGFAAGKAEVQRAWDAEKIANQLNAIDAQKNSNDETARRLDAAERKNRDDAETIALLSAAAADARTAEQRVRNELARIAASAGRGQPASDPAASDLRTAVSAIGDVLAACVARHRELGEDAARDHAAGLSCEQRYDSLTDRADSEQ